jgi:predicted nucleic acid-binding protein
LASDLKVRLVRRQRPSLAERYGLTLYDAAYSAVARARRAELVTLDKALLQSGRGRRPSAVVADLQRST